jgi:hypothetical protein
MRVHLLGGNAGKCQGLQSSSLGVNHGEVHREVHLGVNHVGRFENRPRLLC